MIPASSVSGGPLMQSIGFPFRSLRVAPQFPLPSLPNIPTRIAGDSDLIHRPPMDFLEQSGCQAG